MISILLSFLSFSSAPYNSSKGFLKSLTFGLLSKLILLPFWAEFKFESFALPINLFLTPPKLGFTLNLLAFFFFALSFSFQFEFCFSKSLFIIFFQDILFSLFLLLEFNSLVTFLDISSIFISSCLIFTYSFWMFNADLILLLFIFFSLLLLFWLLSLLSLFFLSFWRFNCTKVSLLVSKYSILFWYAFAFIGSFCK